MRKISQHPFKKELSAFFLIIGVLFLTSCIVLPVGYDSFNLSEIVIGESTREDVVDVLGDPNLLKHDNSFAYHLYKGKYFALTPKAEFAGVYESAIHNLVVDFDESGLTSAVKVEALNVTQLPKTTKPTSFSSIYEEKTTGHGEFIISSQARYLAHTGCNAVDVVSLVGGMEKQVVMFDVNHDDAPYFTGCANLDVRFSNDDSFMTVYAGGGDLYVRDLQRRQTTSTLTIGDYDIASIRAISTLTRNDAVLVYLGDHRGLITSINVTANKKLATISAHNDAVVDMALCGNSEHIISVGKDGSISIIDTRDNVLLQSATRHEPVLSVACSGDGEYVAILSRYHFEVWRLGNLFTTKQSLGELLMAQPLPIDFNKQRKPMEGGRISDYEIGDSFIFFSPDSSTVAVYGGGASAFWDIAGQKPLLRLARAKTIAIDTEGRVIVAEMTINWNSSSMNIYKASSPLYEHK